MLAVYALLFVPGTSPAADFVYAGAAFLACARLVPWAPLLPLLAAVFGLSSWVVAIVSAVLVAVGPLLATTVIAFLEVPFSLLRRDDSEMGQIAALVLIGGRLTRLALLMCAVLAFWQAGVWGVVALVPASYLILRGFSASSALLGILGSSLTDWSLAPLLVAGAGAAIAAWRMLAPMPPLWHPLPPVPRRGPVVWWRAARCDRLISRGELIAARDALGRRPSDAPALQLRLGFLDVEERSYQTALSLEPPAGWAEEDRLFALLLAARARSGIAQFDLARDDLVELGLRWTGDDLHEIYLHVLTAENELAAGEIDAARDSAERALDYGRRKGDYFLRLRARSVLIDCAADGRKDPQGFEACADALSEEMISDRRVAFAALASEPTAMVRKLFGRRAPLHEYFLRVEILGRREEIEETRDGWDASSVAFAIAVSGRPDDLVDLLLGEARKEAMRGRRAAGLTLVARALIELDASRYLLAAQSARSSWSRRFERALALALELADAEKDHRLLGELLEFARVQALPAASAEASADIRLATPPVVLVRGISRLARPGSLERPDPVELEVAAERVGGPGTWWLSYWEADGWLYATLVGPEGTEIGADRRPIGPGSALLRLLTELEAALPFIRPGEDPAAVDFRLQESPLLVDPPAERHLCRRLARALLPADLAGVARAADSGRLPLAIAPAPSLSFVPWGLLSLEGPDGEDDRLVELCDWSIAPSAALIDRAGGRDPEELAPLGLMLADTIDAAELGELPAARSQAATLPGDVAILGGPHWSARPATPAMFEAEMRRIGPDHTLAFLGHAIRGTSAEPSRGGLVLSPEPDHPDRLQILGAAQVFSMADAGVPMPARVLLEACDTSALGDAVSGEWLTVAPALIAAGAGEVITTIYPTPDLAPDDDPLIAAALSGRSLREALMRSQRVGLMRWRSAAGDHLLPIQHTPLSWAAYAPICALPASGSRPPRPSRTSSECVSNSLQHILASSVNEGRGRLRRRLHSGFVLAAVLADSGIAELYDGASTSMRPWTFFWTLGPYLCSRFLPFGDGRTHRLALDDGTEIEVSEAILDAYRIARRTAGRDGVLVEPEHLLMPLLARRSAARRILGLLSALTRRPVELTMRALTHKLSMRIASGQRPASYFATATAVPDRLALAMIRLAEEEDG